MFGNSINFPGPKILSFPKPYLFAHLAYLLLSNSSAKITSFYILSLQTLEDEHANQSGFKSLLAIGFKDRHKNLDVRKGRKWLIKDLLYGNVYFSSLDNNDRHEF